ncbi:putative polysaccharide biosynthesis protein [Streptococcus sp. DD12]|uniref:putative polysaccharide biosynthesis protein n=1 Tax=Streptococcus sp. DD12 TaxID=1777880 RepID=UPI000794787D|nr:polysaccharide biosynthesis protein [Streptococcus sp. DD12]KXT75933.1 Membrane protein involved in the export of O-antigen, teichoic acid lipoteichoic acid [Streptococcus sp. DD12]
MPEQGQTQEQTMLRGTAWLTAANFISRLLGALYIIPWYMWMGKYGAQGNALFGMGYNIYALFLLISTAGIPVAVAKQVSKYNTLGQEATSFYLIRKILTFMLGLGAIFAVIMYLFSPALSRMSGGGDDLIPVMHSLAPAVLIFPCMSVLRGYFQGFNDLKPYAVSQICEQVIRVIWMLLATFYIMQIGSGNYLTAVTQSTFAAFIGMLASFGVLFYYLWRKGMLVAIFGPKPENISLSANRLILETIREAIPFIITGAAIQIFQIIDQLTFSNVMSFMTTYSQKDLQVQFAYMTSNPSKVTMILIAVATSIAGAGIPLLTQNFVNKDFHACARLIINTFQMLLVVLVPAIFGALVLARPLYTIFYGLPSDLALMLFVASLVQVIFLALYSMIAPMLQALFENRKAILYFVYGLVVKLILQVPAIVFLEAYGPILATAIGLTVPIVLMYKQMQRVTHFNRRLIWRQILLILLMTAVMTLVILPINWGLTLLLPATRLGGGLQVALIGAIGILVYGYLALKTHAADKLLGSRAQALRDRFHL